MAATVANSTIEYMSFSELSTFPYAIIEGGQIEKIDSFVEHYILLALTTRLEGNDGLLSNRSTPGEIKLAVLPAMH